MYENKNDRQFENSDKGQEEEDRQNREDTLSQAQTRSDRIHDDADNNNPTPEEDDTGVIVGGNSEREQMNHEEYDLSRLHAIPKNDDFSSMNEELDKEKDLDEEDDLEEDDLEEDDLEEDDLEEDDLEEEDERINAQVYGDDLSGFRDSRDQRRDDYRNDEKKNPGEFYF
ncbi:MAG: hypothetical protein K0M40_12975 [Prolixibacteraceae bacterium]|nr:hypothetical protein [Prolixibacteraceae bacterium]